MENETNRPDLNITETIIESLPEEILEREVKKFGTGSAHIIFPKKHIGKRVSIIVHKQHKQENKSQS